MGRLSVAVFLVLLLITGPGARAASAGCVPVEVTTDAAHRVVHARFELPAGRDGLPLAPFDGYHRSRLWRSPDGSTRIEDDRLVPARPGARVLRVDMDSSGNLPRIDRTYAPFLRFADGTVALDSALFAPAPGTPPACLRLVAPQGQTVSGFGRARVPVLSVDTGRHTGYAAFGKPLVQRSRSLLLISDAAAPESVRRRLMTLLPRVAGFYRDRLGPQPTPTVLLYTLPAAGPLRDYHGDRLADSITLGLLGTGWNAPGSGGQDLLEFVAHELFHDWNAAGGLHPASDLSNLASEGGADLAARWAAGGGRLDPVLGGVGGALASCAVTLGPDGRLDGDRLGSGSGKLPYDCGEPLLLLIGAANAPGDPAAGFFAGWRHLIALHRDAPASGYAWSDLLLPGARNLDGATLRAAVEGHTAYVPVLIRALARAGFEFAPMHTWPAGVRKQMNARLMAALMAHDCHGRVGFWMQPDGFLLDHGTPRCDRLPADGRVIALAGTALADDDPAQLRQTLAAACARDGRVRVGFAAPAPALDIDCPPAWPVLDRLSAIVGYRAPSPPGSGTAERTPPARQSSPRQQR